MSDHCCLFSKALFCTTSTSVTQLLITRTRPRLQPCYDAKFADT